MNEMLIRIGDHIIRQSWTGNTIEDHVENVQLCIRRIEEHLFRLSGPVSDDVIPVGETSQPDLDF